MHDPFLCQHRVFDDKSIPVGEYFIPFHLRHCGEGGTRHLQQPEECLRLVEEAGCLVLLGARGMGKTHFLRCIYAEARSRAEYLPVRVDLTRATTPAAVERVIGESLAAAGDRAGTVLVLLDNYEAAGSGVTAQDLVTLRTRFADARWAVTLPDHQAPPAGTAYRIEACTRQDAFRLWQQLDRFFGYSVSGFITGLVQDHEAVFEGYLENPLFTALLYRVSIFFAAAQGSAYDIFKPMPARHKFFRLRYATEQLLIKEFKEASSQKEQVFVATHHQERKELPLLTPGKHDLIIEPHANGLGDLLWLSHLPRLAKEQGRYERVLVSKNKHQNALVWECNPYVDGYCLAEKTPFKVDGKEIDEIILQLSLFRKNSVITVNGKQYGSREINLMDWLMLKFGLDDQQRFHRPEVYYQPAPIATLRGKVIYDPYWVSNPRIETKNFFCVDAFFKRKGITPDYQMKFADDKQLLNSKYMMIPTLQFGKFLSTLTLFDFCNVLASVEHVYCLTTGTATLTHALGVKTTVLLDEEPCGVHHATHHHYLNVLA